jgi:hypothetical protein
MGITLAKHPLAEKLENYHSVELITSPLQDQARAFSEFRICDRIMKSIKNTVSVLCMLVGTAAVGDSIGLVRQKTLMRCSTSLILLYRHSHLSKQYILISLLRQIDNADREVAHRLLQCAAASFYPPRVEQLAELVAFDFKTRPTPTFCEDWREEDPVDAVLSTCSGFLHIVNVKGSLFVHFSHPSVKEFLMSTRVANAGDENLRRYHISMTPAHTIAAQACLGMLPHLDENVIRDSFQGIPLASYSAVHWFDHALFENVSQSVEDGMKQLFDPSQPHCATWAWIYDAVEHAIQPERARFPGGTAFHYAAFIGLQGLVKVLANEHSQDVHSRDFYDSFAFGVA